MKLRPMGKILLDMELLLEEMVDGHDLQRGDILALVDVWIQAHRPGAIEEYEDGTHPVMKYGPVEEE